jgi:hypothetical protein
MRIGGRREAQRHAALCGGGTFKINIAMVRAKAVSRLPPCHRSPKSQLVDVHPWDIEYAKGLIQSALNHP